MVEPNQDQSSRRSSPRGVDIKSKPGQYPDMRGALVLASVLAFAVAAAGQAGPVTAPIVGEFTGGVVFYRSNGSMREAQYARLVIKQRASGMSGSVKWNLSTVPSGATPVCVHLIKSIGGRGREGMAGNAAVDRKSTQPRPPKLRTIGYQALALIEVSDLAQDDREDRAELRLGADPAKRAAPRTGRVDWIG
jgi:hypothetical protein